MTSQTVRLNGHDLTIEQVVNVARDHAKVEMDSEKFGHLQKFRDGLDECVARGDVIYGVNTGCGSRKSEVMEADELADYQARYIPAHCCGMGELLPEDIVRAAMLIRLNSFLRGNSGIQPWLCQLLCDFLNLGITPCVPQYGSVGASGDLVPLAHTCAALMGLPQAKVIVEGQQLSATEALKRFKLEPWVLGAKEAMAFTNGANFIAAIGCLALNEAAELFFVANLALALSLEAIRGEQNAFDQRIHTARALPGQVRSAQLVREFIRNSKRMSEEARAIDLKGESTTRDAEGKKVPRVQDAYSFRCAPQIHASTYHALEHARELLEIEINSSTDNPLIFRKGETFETISGGNFHGQPLASLLEYLGIALAALAGVSDRRMFALLSPSSSYGLPADLAGPTHGNTGLMIAQYAGAGLVNEIAHLSAPCSVHSVPTSANQEDWVSMGMNSALHLRQMLPLVRYVLATELLGAAQGIMLTEDVLADHNDLGLGTSIVYAAVSSVWYTNEKPLQETQQWFRDRHVASAVQGVVNLIKDSPLIKTINNAIKQAKEG